MSNEPTPEGNVGETLKNYPELSRARDLVIELFKDKSPLRILGYTEKQIAFAVPAIELVQEEGHIVTIEGGSFLSWTQDHNWLAAEIYSLPQNLGYRLNARRDEASKGNELLDPVQRFTKMLFIENPVVIFKDFDVGGCSNSSS